ncbi:MAG: SMP-30/gluconolactonase/LRE family protein [Hyphomonadaceae bacterium]
MNSTETKPPQRTGDPTLTPGDVIVAANDTIQPADMRAGLKGWGRLLHCDAALNIKGELRTGDFGLLIGLMLTKAGEIYVTSPQLWKLAAYTSALEPVAFKPPPRRRYGNMISDRKGGVLIGVHSGHGEPPEPDQYGDGKLVRFDPKTGESEFFDVEIDGGRSGKHYVSNLALAPDNKTVFYVSEAGRRVKRYDIEARKQLDDFLFVPEDQGGTYGLGIDVQGRVILGMGVSAALLTPEGEIIRRYEVSSDKGWTRAAFCVDQDFFFLSNFLDGVLERRSVETGEVLHKLDVGLRGSLTTAVEYAPDA